LDFFFWGVREIEVFETFDDNVTFVGVHSVRCLI
jgi:hypothetical protein